MNLVNTISQLNILVKFIVLLFLFCVLTSTIISGE